MLFSILQPLENVMKSILDFLHTSVGLPWAWSIVALTILVRIVLVPLTVRQIHSMQSLQAHAPEMKALQAKYKGDRQKLNEELMKFYKENNINPAASCLPLLAQFPVFIALYFTLKHGTKHITGSWLHVVPNIADKATAHWSGFVLLAIYAGSQNGYIAEITLATRVRVQPFRRAQFRNLGRLAKSHAEHDRVVVAIMRGDHVGAAAAMRAHIELVRGEYEIYAVSV